MHKKIKILFIILLGIVVISFFIFFLFCDKTKENGNTITNRSEEEMIQSILNMEQYTAEMLVEVQSNKNNNQYKIKQTYTKPNREKQEILEPSHIAGIITEYDGQNLILTNPKLNLSSLYENYPYAVSNDLWLGSFASDYQTYTNKKSSIEEGQILLEVKNEMGNKYNLYKKLYIDTKTGKPTKLIVQDINQNTTIYISYTKIEIS